MKARKVPGLDVHDCDVMLPRAAGIEALQALLHDRRERHFRHFHDLLQAQASEGVWAALERAVRAGP